MTILKVGPFLRQHRWSLLILLTLAAIGSYLIYRTTSSGIGLRDDSYSYISAAESMARGKGYGRLDYQGEAKPITNFPPGYPLLLTGAHLGGLELQASARLISGLSLSSIVFLVGLTVLWGSRKGMVAAAAAGFVLLSPSLLESLTWALSEGPYLSLLLASFLLAALFLETPRRKVLLILCAALAGFAFLTRYVGWTVIAATTALMVTSDPRRLGANLKDAALYSSLAVLPTAVFLLRNLIVAGTATNRPAPYWHPPSQEKILAGARTMLSWLLPESALPLVGTADWVLAAVLLLGLGGLPFVLQLGSRPANSDRGEAPIRGAIARLHGIHLILYGAFLLVSVSWLDRLTPLNVRILAPLQLNVIVLVGFLAAKVWGSKGTWRRGVVGVVLVGACLFQARRGLTLVNELAADGLGFNSERWRSSQTLEYVREQVPPGVPLYSNNLPALYFLADRHAIFVPSQFNPASQEATEDYREDLRSMRERIQQEDGQLIIIGSAPRSRIPADQLEDLTEGLTLVAEFGDGLVYQWTR